ncbi:MAG: ATP-binding cassette domain-containing protein [Myxococcales bacterium]|nr:ATP-binding cassette domain-containing protein [Myxococcales bacterium]
MALEERTEANRQNFLRRELEWLARQPKARTTKQKARIERAETAKAAVLARRTESVQLAIEEARSGKTVLELHGFGLDIGGQRLIESLDLFLTEGERVAIVGRNGTGKTSLLRAVVGELAATRGRLVQGANTKVAYFDQERTGLDLDKTVFENVSEGGAVEIGGVRLEPRAYLERFLFDGHAQRQKVASLSGGERASRFGEDAARQDEPGALGRADQRSRRRHAGRARGDARELRRLGHRRHPRSLLPRSHRDLAPRLRGRWQGHAVPGQLRDVPAPQEGAGGRGRTRRKGGSQGERGAEGLGQGRRPGGEGREEQALLQGAKRARNPSGAHRDRGARDGRSRNDAVRSEPLQGRARAPSRAHGLARGEEEARGRALRAMGSPRSEGLSRFPSRIGPVRQGIAAMMGRASSFITPSSLNDWSRGKTLLTTPRESDGLL